LHPFKSSRSACLGRWEQTFLRHLIDVDAASHTLSWCWVAGLQTVGKTYLATTHNIARYTNSRVVPKGLAREALALTEVPVQAACGLMEHPRHDPARPSALLVTHEDMHPESVFDGATGFRKVIVSADADLPWGEDARRAMGVAGMDTATRAELHFGCGTKLSERLDAETLIAAANSVGVKQIAAPGAPARPVADALAQIALVLAREDMNLSQVRRAWNSALWPRATKGVFASKKRIPAILQERGVA
jgi:deoxyribodipyrimidine photo-lyase